jgi:hypothetical protein
MPGKKVSGPGEKMVSVLFLLDDLHSGTVSLSPCRPDIERISPIAVGFVILARLIPAE